jgi:23S rRNA pseudouridine1911/1915/1917 synthase
MFDSAYTDEGYVIGSNEEDYADDDEDEDHDHDGDHEGHEGDDEDKPA